MKRGAIKKRDAVFFGVWVPKQITQNIDEAIKSEDLDRSKFVRAAIREKLSRMNLIAS